MLIPAWKAYRTSYWECVTALAGSQMNGYSRAAIPSVEAEVAQPICTIRQISQAMKLIGSRSTRAAISPGMTKVPPVAAPEVSCAIAVLLAAIRSQGDGKVNRGGAAPRPVSRTTTWTCRCCRGCPGTRPAMLVIKREPAPGSAHANT